MHLRAATLVQQSCKSCRTCFMFYCMFYFACDRFLKVRTDAILKVDIALFPWSGRILLGHHHSVLQFAGGRLRWLVERAAAGVKLQRLSRRHSAADAGVRLLDDFEHLGEIVLNGGHGGDDRRRAEAVRDEREVGESSLNGRVEHRRRTSVAQRRSVLIQQINQLLHHLPAITHKQTHPFYRSTEFRL